MNAHRLAALLAAAGILTAAAPVLAQDYPNRPIRMIVPYPPGGPTDIMGRLTSDVLTRRLAQNVIVDNRGGAATAIGATLAARAQADGYTLLLSSETTFAVNPSLRPNLSYQVERDFAPVSMLTTQPYVLGIAPTVSAKTVAELIAHARANPGKLSYGSAGTGSANHLAGELFKQAAGVNAVHVPYKGNGPAIVDLISGQIAYMLGSISSIYPHAAAKKLRLLGVASDKRVAAAPELPTLSESGLPGFRVFGWNGIVAPKGTPRAVIDKLNAEVRAGFADPAVRARLAKQSIDPATGTPEDFGAHIRSESERYGKLIQAVGLKVR